MRVLHLAPSPQSASGIAAYAVSYRAALRDAGVEIELLPAPDGAVNTLADVRRYVAAARAAADDGYDVVHAELGGGSLREFYALRHFQRHTALPSVGTLHDAPRVVWWPFHTRAVRQYRQLGRAVRLLSTGVADRLERQTINGLDAIATLAPSGRDAVIDLFGPQVAERVGVLPYPITGIDWPEARAENPDLLIGFLGYWYEGKGLLRLVDALAALRSRGVDFHAQFWGTVSAHAGTRPGLHYRDRVVDAIRDHGLVDRVSISGFLDEPEVATRLRACDVVVLPYETSPVTASLRSTSASMFNAFAAGTPVIACDVKALSDDIEPDTNGILLPPGDVDALTDALERIVADRSLFNALRAGAARKARSLDAGASATAAAEIYERVTR